jgi:hypothetical protein
MKNPIQPLGEVNGVMRFKANAIVRHLLDTHQTCDMNTLARMTFSDDDRQQFAQLIGYSVSGFGDLSYADPAMVEQADRISAALQAKRDTP